MLTSLLTVSPLLTCRGCIMTERKERSSSEIRITSSEITSWYPMYLQNTMWMQGPALELRLQPLDLRVVGARERYASATRGYASAM